MESPSFFHLRTPIDLLNKMEHHLRQLSADPLNVYAAFDFFVAAEHLPEWLGKFRCAPGRGDKRAQAVQRICSQLANGAKHFSTDPERHSSIQGTTLSTPATSGVARSGITLAGAVQTKLLILLQPEEAATLGVPAISAVNLAQSVVTFWREHAMVQRAHAISSLGTDDDGAAIDKAPNGNS